MTTEELKESLAAVHGLLAQGKFIEAMEAHLDDEVVLEEVGSDPKRGKRFCIESEATFLEGVSAFGGYRVSSIGYAKDTTFYEAVMEYTQTDGKQVRVQQCVVDEWRDGKIVHERFYHT